MKHITIALLALAVFLSGCSQNLSFLMRLNNEDKALKQQLTIQKNKFDELLKDIKSDRLKTGTTQDSIVGRYGEPILEIPDAATQETKLLYRHPTDYFGASKAYLYFNNEQKLLRWELIER